MPPQPEPPPPPPPPPLHARHLPLPPTASPPASLLLAPSSRSLALLFPDSSALLFPSLPTPISPPSTPTPIPSPHAAAACFVLLPSSHLLFLSASPSPSSPTSLLLRAYSLTPAGFSPRQLSYKRHVSTALPLHGLPFGLGVRLAGGVNAVALHSLAANQIWLLAPRLAADGRVVELHKCAVVELEAARPVYTMGVAMGRLLLGEAGGVRVFPLKSLMKGGKEREGGKEGVIVGAESKSLRMNNGLLNGLVVPVGRSSDSGGDLGDAAGSTCKLTTARVKQNSGNYCSFFVAFDNSRDHDSLDGVDMLKSAKAVSIHPLSKNKFLVLDSAGVLYLFSLPNIEMISEAASKHSSENIQTYRLDYFMKVQLFAVFPSSSTKTQIFWVSDGGHSIHVMSALNIEAPYSNNGDNGGERKITSIKLSAIEAIFTSAKVQDIVPISKDSVFVLGQGKMFLYGTA